MKMTPKQERLARSYFAACWHAMGGGSVYYDDEDGTYSSGGGGEEIISNVQASDFGGDLPDTEEAFVAMCLECISPDCEWHFMTVPVSA